MARVLVGIGSNLQDPQYQVEQAMQALYQHPDCILLKSSSYYQTPPLGGRSQPDYVNAVVLLETALGPQQLLVSLQQLERQLGREIPHQHHASRVIDLDILLYDQLTLQTVALKIPHPGLFVRNFVLYPMLEIVPYWVLPSGCSLENWMLSSNMPRPKRIPERIEVETL